MDKHELGRFMDDRDLLMMTESLPKLDEKVGTETYSLFDLEPRLKDARLEVGGGCTIEGSEDMHFSARIFSPDRPPTLFDAEALQAPAGSVYSELDLSARASVLASTPFPKAVGFEILGTEKLSLEVDYRHLLPVECEAPRREAVASLLQGSRLPQEVTLRDLAALKPGEVHAFDRRLHADAKLEATYGKEWKRVEEAFSKAYADLPIELHGKAVVKASLGLSLYDELRLSVGRARLIHEDWVRLMLRKAHEERLTLGAQLALQLDYDAQSAFQSVLEEIFNQVPLRDCMDSLRSVCALIQPLDDQSWPQLRERLSGKAVDLVGRLVGQADWWQRTWSSESLAKLLGGLADFVAAYDDLQGELQSLFERCLLGDHRQALDRVKARLQLLSTIDPTQPVALLGGLDEGALPWVEVLTRMGLDEILVGGSAVQEVLESARKLAREGLEFIAALEGALNAPYLKLQELAGSIGLAQLVTWVRGNATSLEGLRKAVGEWEKAKVSWLLDKAFAQLDKHDLKTLNHWAKQADHLLSAPLELQDALEKAIDRLKGTIGFSCGIELDRALRSGAIIDLEIDPRANEPWTEPLLDAFRRADAQTMIEVLEIAARDDDFEASRELPPEGYALRECVLTSRRMSAFAQGFFLSFLGLDREIRCRLQESRIHARPDDGRIAEHAAGFVVTKVGKEKSPEKGEITFRAGAWHTLEAKYALLDRDRSFQGMADGIRLVVQRDDSSTTSGEWAGLRALLTDLGFVAAQLPATLPILGERLSTELALDLSIPGGVAAFWQGVAHDVQGWERDAHNAAYRWFQEPLIGTSWNIDGGHVPQRDSLAALMQDPTFVQHWTRGLPDVEAALKGESLKLEVDGVTRFEPIVLGPDIGHPGICRWGQWEELRPAATLVQFARTAPETFDAIEGAWRKCQAEHTSASYERFTRRAMRALSAMTPSLWQSPLFPVWLTLVRLGRVRPELLENARGLAMLRWKKSGALAWESPVRMTLDPGLLKERAVTFSHRFVS